MHGANLFHPEPAVFLGSETPRQCVCPGLSLGTHGGANGSPESLRRAVFNDLRCPGFCRAWPVGSHRGPCVAFGLPKFSF